MGKELMERNREILAERLGWPDGALEAVRKLEADHAGYFAWWDRGGLPSQPEPGYCASRSGGRLRQRLYAATAGELDALIARDAVRYPPAWWEVD